MSRRKPTPVEPKAGDRILLQLTDSTFTRRISVIATIVTEGRYFFATYTAADTGGALTAGNKILLSYYSIENADDRDVCKFSYSGPDRHAVMVPDREWA